MKILKPIPVFVLFLGVQLYLITFLEYLLFLIPKGVRQELLESLSPQSSNLDSLMDYFTIFNTWFTRILFKGDFGVLNSLGMNIGDFIFEYTVTTLMLVLGALIVSLLLGFLLLYLKKNFAENKLVSMFLSFMRIFSSIHYLILGYFVVVGYPSLTYMHTIFPYLILAIGNGMLNDMVHLLEVEYDQVMKSKYILAARARGGNILKNIYPPLGISLARIINSKLPHLLGGSFIVEFVLNVQGLGIFTIHYGIRGMDYNLLLVITFLVTIVIVVSNLIANQFQNYLDPRPAKVL